MFSIKSFKTKIGVAVLTACLLPLQVFAQQAPTPPTTAVQLAQTVNLSDAQAAGLVIVGLLVAVGVVLWGARLVLSKFSPKV